jgi:HEPN domain-containing protein
MRKESLRLLEQSRHDIDTSAQLLKIKIYYASVFFAEQAAEKTLKALHIEKKRKAEFTHDLVELAHLGYARRIIEWVRLELKLET